MSMCYERLKRGVIAGVTTAAMVCQPQLLLAAEAAPAPAKKVALSKQLAAPTDVVLQDKGVLVGRVLNAQGAAVANSPVTLKAGGKVVAQVMSDNTGRFQATGLKGGVYHVASTGHQGAYRLWAPRTAPPAAARGLSIVSQPVDVVRGQYGGGTGGTFATIGQWIAEHPIITAGAVAAAIAVPIAVADDDDPPASP